MVLEAFAAGLPVVALPGLGTDDAGDHWANVIMARTPAPTRSPPPCATPCSGTSAIASRAGALIADAFDWTRIGGRILDVFHRAVGRPARSSDARQQAVA